MTIAIFRKDIGNYSETFVRKNIESLNEGRTVVVCDRYADTPAWKPRVPVLCLRHVPPPLRPAATYLFLKRHRVRAVVCEFLDYAAEWAPLFNRLSLPYVALGHGYDLGRDLRKYGDYARLLRRLKTAVRIVVPCEAGKTALLKRLDCEPAFVESIPVGIDLSAFPEPSYEPRPEEFVFVGRFVEKKAPVPLLLAFHRALALRPGMTLHCVGDGPLLPAARQLVRCLGLGDRVRFHGAQPHARVLEHLRRARGAVQHSVTAENGDMETMPLSIQEALACGTPAVVSRHAGLPDIVADGVTGFLVDEFDLETMALRIAELASLPPAAYRRLQSACFAERARFSYLPRTRRIGELLGVEHPPRAPLRGLRRLFARQACSGASPSP